MKNVDKPINREDRYNYAIIQRLDALCHMMSTFIEVYADKNKIATTDNKVIEEVQEVVTSKEEVPKPKTTSRKRK